MKKLLSILLVTMMILSLTSVASAAGASSDGRTVLTFWYNNSGDEAAPFEQIVENYNNSQSTYFVEGLSVTDQQKIIVAMASNETPDIVKTSTSSLNMYQTNGLLDSLQPYMDAEGYDTSNFMEPSLAAMKIDDNMYALPFSCYTIQMYYNKDILESIGYSEPPKTMEEMYEMAVKATTLDDKGNIDVLGYPLFPLASARQELVYGFGGRWWDEEGNFTPNTQGAKDSLTYNMQYRELYGIERVAEFIAAANTNRYTEQDMFFVGKQLFRIDGNWLPTQMQGYGSTVNYGITLIPGTESNPEYLGSSRLECGCACIPLNAPNKEGAWDFIKFLSNEESAKLIDISNGYPPALVTLFDDADILAIPGMAEFIDATSVGVPVQYPANINYSKYTSLIDEHLDYIYNGIMTVDEGLNELESRVNSEF